MIDDYEVLVAAAGAIWEASCVVGLECADGLHPYMELFGQVRRRRVLDGGSRRGGEVGVVRLG